jgi:PAS domain S-box-containing protein
MIGVPQEVSVRLPESCLPEVILAPEGPAGSRAVLLAANQAFADLAGVPLASLLGRPADEVMDAAGAEALARALRGGTGRVRVLGRLFQAAVLPTGRPGEALAHLRAEADGEAAGPADLLAGLPMPAFLVEPDGQDRFRFVTANHRPGPFADGVAILAGKRLDEVLPPDQAAGLEGHLRDALERQAPIIFRAPGEPGPAGLHWETRLTPLGSAAGTTSRVLGLSFDATDRILAEQALKESEQRLRAIFESAAFGIAFAAADGRLLDINRTLAQMLGGERESFLGRPLDALFQPDEGEEDALGELLAGRRPLWHGERRLTGADGQPGAWAHVGASLVCGGDRGPCHAVLILEDVTEARRAAEQIRYLASYDHATGLPNLPLFGEKLDSILRQAAGGRQEGERRGPAVMAIGFERLAGIQIGLEHDQPGRLARLVADRLRRRLGPADLLGRLGDGLFAVALGDGGDRSAVLAAAGRIVAGFVGPLSAEPADLVMMPAIGISRHPTDGRTAAALIRAAGVALQRARMDGSPGIEFYEPHMANAAAARLGLEGRLRLAIERDEFHLLYQPKMNADTLEITGFEALIRWHDPEHGIVSPDHFIPVAEETGLILPLGDLVLEKACRCFAQWRKEGVLDVPVSVNLSARQLADPDFGRRVLRMLADTGLPAERLKLELTESALFGSTEAVRDVLTRLHGAGVGFLLDDFGTGYSSLAYLKRFPIEAIKIDRSFIQPMVEDRDSASIVHAIINMAHALNMEVVAEGVETKEQLIFLRAYRCDRLQGYLMSPPLSACEVVAAMNRTTDGIQAENTALGRA